MARYGREMNTARTWAERHDWERGYAPDRGRAARSEMRAYDWRYRGMAPGARRRELDWELGRSPSPYTAAPRAPGYRPGRVGYGGEYAPAGAFRGGHPNRGRSAERVRARDIMTPDPETVNPETTIADAAKKMRELNVGILPVTESEGSRRLTGVITDRDLAVRALAEGKGGQTQVKSCMSEDLHTVNQNDGLEEVLRVMERNQVRRVPVVDRERRLVGIVAQADLAVNYAGFDHDREVRVEEALERISEPAHPNR